ncbi:MAG: anti-sigma factor domain-containing protein [Bacillota bacterium]|nr:anti-sigma factor domain-containing protein [Bacillota bacterium]
MNKTGLVMKIEKNSAVLATSAGEFVKVAISTPAPKIGETYTGTVKKEISYTRHLAAAVALFAIFLFGGSAYAYNTPMATVQVNINPSIELKTNRFDRIITATPINGDGETLLKQLKLKNKKIDDALILVINQAKRDKFINDSYIASGRTITVKVSSKNTEKTINLDKFEKFIADQKINATINNNGKETNDKFYNENTNNESSKNISPQNNESKAINDQSKDNENNNKQDNITNVNNDKGNNGSSNKQETKGNETKPPSNQPTNAQNHSKDNIETSNSSSNNTNNTNNTNAANSNNNNDNGKVKKGPSKHKNNK